MDLLSRHRKLQNEMRLQASAAWIESKFVFTDELGKYLSARTVYNNFKKAMSDIGTPDIRFHDLRHSYAVAALTSGDNVKNVQENMGHHTAAFTLDQYGHISERMRLESANKMDKFIQGVKSM